MTDFSIYGLHRELMKADLQISIKDCQHNENLETRSRPVRPVTSGVCLGSGPSFSSVVFRQIALCSSSAIVQVWSVSPAACAGIIPSAEWTRQKSKCATKSATA